MKNLLIKTFALLCLPILFQQGLIAKKLKGIDLPKNIGSFLYQDSYDYEKESPGLGKSLAYRTTEGVVATIYVYDLQRKGIEEGTEDPIIRESAQATAREIGIISERQKASDLSISDFKKISVGPSKMWYSQISYKDQSGEKRNSVALLTGYKSNILKIRITGGVEKERFDAVVEFFLRDLGAKVLKQKKGKKNKTIVIDENSMNSPNGTLYTVYTLVKQGLDDPYSFETEHAAMELVALALEDDKVDAEERIDRSDLRLQEFLKVHNAGFLNEYVWVFARNYVWERPSGLKLDAFEKWMAVEMPEHELPVIFTGP